MDSFTDFLESVFADIRLEDSARNTLTRYRVPKRWLHMIEQMAENLRERGYTVEIDGDTLIISWDPIEVPAE